MMIEKRKGIVGRKKRAAIVIALLFGIMNMLSSCGSGETERVDDTLVKKPKYIFLFIGDGMGYSQAALLDAYLGTVEHDFTGTKAAPTPENPPQGGTVSFLDFPVTGSVTTYDASKYITDSAAAGTAMACGSKTLDGRLGIDPDGRELTSAAEVLQKEGYKIGLVSSVSLDHATPAAFYANTDSRSNYYEIGKQLVASGFDYFGGGGFRSDLTLEGGQIPVLQLAEEAGYRIADTEEEIISLDGNSGKTIAVNPILTDGERSFPFEIDRRDDGLRLRDFVEQGIEVMGEEEGFFMMCEGGMIDWACHANDASSALRELQEFEESVDAALEFYESHPDETLIIVTGDHETGGMSVGSNAAAYDTYLTLLDLQDVASRGVFCDAIAGFRESGASFDDAMAYVKEHIGLTFPGDSSNGERMMLTDYEISILQNAYQQSMIPTAERTMDEAYLLEYTRDMNYEPFAMTTTRIIDSRAGVGWTSTAHTGVPVAIYAKGSGAEQFDGSIDNTDICKIIQSLVVTSD